MDPVWCQNSADLDFSGGRCVMLDEKTNLCTVDELRSTQCRTFPYWPAMIGAPVRFGADTFSVGQVSDWTVDAAVATFGHFAGRSRAGAVDPARRAYKGRRLVRETGVEG